MAVPCTIHRNDPGGEREAGRRLGGGWEAAGRWLGGGREEAGRRLGGGWEEAGRRLGGSWEEAGRRGARLSARLNNSSSARTLESEREVVRCVGGGTAPVLELPRWWWEEDEENEDEVRAPSRASACRRGGVRVFGGRGAQGGKGVGGNAAEK